MFFTHCVQEQGSTHDCTQRHCHCSWSAFRFDFKHSFPQPVIKMPLRSCSKQSVAFTSCFVLAAFICLNGILIPCQQTCLSRCHEPSASRTVFIRRSSPWPCRSCRTSQSATWRSQRRRAASTWAWLISLRSKLLSFLWDVQRIAKQS